MISDDRIGALVLDAIQGTDLFLMEVRIMPSNVIEVYIDSDTAVSIDQCVAVSRYVESHLDRDVEDFELNVLSWGLSRPLSKDRQLRKYLGKAVEVKTKEKGKIQGSLVAFDDQQVTITPTPVKKPSKRKPAVEGDLTFQRNQATVYPAIIF